MGDVDPKVIKKTQDLLGKLIKKPPLTEKLLSRPPFRYIHDICTSLTRSTGIMKGLFTADEFNGDCIKDKEAKAAYLKKVIEFVTAANNRAPNVKIGSIISGRDAESTNILLQLLADVANRGIDNEVCVNKALGVTHVSRESPRKPEKKETKKKEASSPRHGSACEPPKKGSSESRKKASSSGRSKDQNHEKRKEKSANPLKKAPSKPQTSKHPETSPDIINDEVVSKPMAGIMDPVENPNSRPVTAASEGTSNQSRASRPSSAKGPKKSLNEPPQSEKRLTTNSSPAIVSPSRSYVKPVTPDPPTIVEDPKEARGPENSVDQTGSPGAPAVVSTVTGLMMENETFSDDDDDDDDSDNSEMVVRNGSGGDGSKANSTRDGEGDFGDEEVEQSNGGLVKKLLKSKRELGGEGILNLSKSKPTSMLIVNEAAKKRDREATEKEMERLCQVLQDLTRSALPLGKLIDLMQEDFESIQMEYREWIGENERIQEQLRIAEGKVDPNIKHLQEELTQLEQKQAEYRQAIASTKANIIKNDNSIQKMLMQVLETT